MTPAALLPRTALDASTSWPGWVPIPRLDDGSHVAEWIDQVVDVFTGLWHQAWNDELESAVRRRLFEAVDARATDPAHLVFEVWPVPGPVSCTVIAVAVPAAEVSGLWHSGAHSLPVRTENLGDGLHIGESRRVAGPDGTSFDIQSEAFVFADDDFAVAVTASDTISHVMTYVRPGLTDIVQTLTLTREDGKPFTGVLPPWLRGEAWNDAPDAEGPQNEGPRGVGA